MAGPGTLLLRERLHRLPHRPQLDLLDQISALPREYPGWMFTQQAARANQFAAQGRPDAR